MSDQEQQAGRERQDEERQQGGLASPGGIGGTPDGDDGGGGDDGASGETQRGGGQPSQSDHEVGSEEGEPETGTEGGAGSPQGDVAHEGDLPTKGVPAPGES